VVRSVRKPSGSGRVEGSPLAIPSMIAASELISSVVSGPDMHGLQLLDRQAYSR
jgi:hypothetical protein